MDTSGKEAYMRFWSTCLTIAILSLTVPASAEVKNISVTAGGVL